MIPINKDCKELKCSNCQLKGHYTKCSESCCDLHNNWIYKRQKYILEFLEKTLSLNANNLSKIKTDIDDSYKIYKTIRE